MDIGAGIILFAIIWVMVFFVVLPIGVKTQGDVGDVTRGTPAGAPHETRLKRKFLITTCGAVVVWGIAAAIIVSGILPVRTFDIMNQN